jgi:hypothetical protein
LAKLNAEQIALLKEPHIAQVVTLMADGSPQISPVWIDTDGTDVLFNTALGRVKTDNVERDALEMTNTSRNTRPDCTP